MVRIPPPVIHSNYSLLFDRATTQVCIFHTTPSNAYPCVEYKEAFALFDKRGTGAVPREVLGDLLRALGQNPTQAEVAEIVASAPRDGTRIPFVQWLIDRPRHVLLVDYRTFLNILNRPDGFKPAGTPGASTAHRTVYCT